MGRKTKKIFPNQYSRTYLFRPRNGLGLYYPKIKSISTSSIFHYNQRNVSPEHSLDNDEDIVGGVLFSSYKELRGLESHSPLPYCLESSGDEDHESIQLLTSQEGLTDFVRSKNSFNYTNSRFIYGSDPVESNFDKSIVTKSFDKLQEAHTIVSSVNAKLASNSPKYGSRPRSENLVNHGELFPTSNQQKPPESDNLSPKRSNTFLIENILRENIGLSSLDRTTSPNAPFIIKPREKELNHIENLSQLSKESENSLGRLVGSHVSDSSFSHFFPLLPEVQTVIHPVHAYSVYKNNIKDAFSSGPEFLSTYTPRHHTHLNQIGYPNDYDLLPDYPSVCKLQQPSSAFLGFSSHDYLFNADNIAPQGSVNRMTMNSLFPPQKRNYKTCMNHAYIAWSIYAKETHLWEEESREKGLYPLSLHSKQSYNRTVLRPKAFRELVCDLNSTVEGTLFPKMLSPFPPACSVLHRGLSQLSHCVSSIQNEQETSDQIFNHIHSNIVATNDLYEQTSKSYRLSSTMGMMKSLNSLPFHVPLSAFPKVPQSNEQNFVNRTCLSDIYPSQHVAFDDRISHELPQLTPSYDKFPYPIFSTKLIRPGSEDSNCQVSSIPLVTLQPIETNSPNLHKSTP